MKTQELIDLLCSTDYEDYCKRDLWSADEFGALVRGLDPKRCLKLIKEEETPIDPKEEKHAFEALKLTNRFLRKQLETQKDSLYKGKFIGDSLYLSAWHYIKWIAINNIPMTIKFIEALPLYLLELIQEFEPINIDLRTAHKCSSIYHRARYLKMAEGLIQYVPTRMSRVEIYHHSSSQNLLREFRKTMGAKKIYTLRTVTELWLPKIDIDPPRGRPFKKTP